jgi:hypothetical protein
VCEHTYIYLFFINLKKVSIFFVLNIEWSRLTLNWVLWEWVCFFLTQTEIRSNIG